MHVVRNGIDTDVWSPTKAQSPTESVLAELGVDPTVRSSRSSADHRQKVIAHLVAAAHKFAPEVQLVLCAGAPDTRRSPRR